MFPRLIALLAVLGGCTGDILPGFRFQVSQKGVDYGRDVLVPILTDALKTVDIPDFSTDQDTPIGHITFKLSRAKIPYVDISHTQVRFAPPAEVTGSITNAAIKLNAHWYYREDSWPHISDSGSLDLTASLITISLDIAVGTTSSGEPHISTKACRFDIGNVDITFHGGTAWLYNLFSSFIADGIKDAIQEQVCPLLKSVLSDDLNKILSTVDLKTDIDEHCYIDYTLVEPPFVIKDSLFVNGKGEIYYKKDPQECPSAKQKLPETVRSDRMATLWITEYMLNTAGFAYQTADFLQYNLTSADIPPEIPIKMTTDFFKFFVPALHKAYPDMDLTLWIQTDQPVTFDINRAGISGRADGTITWLVHVNGTLVPAFTLSAQLDLCVNISVHLGSQSELYLDIITVEPHIQLLDSNIGNFSILPLQTFIKFSRALIVPFINQLVKNGIPLPAFEDITFSGFDFDLENGYIQIHTDVKYTPDRLSTNAPEIYTLFDGDTFTCKIDDDYTMINSVEEVGVFFNDFI